MKKQYLFLLFLICVVFFLDQVTKYIVASQIPLGTYEDPIPVLGNWVYWVHVGNTGVAWSLFAGVPYFFGFLGMAFLASVYFFRRFLELHLFPMQVAIGLMCGGVLGNVVDRFVHGHVVDFIDVHLPGYRYPSFNVADIGIFCGVCLYCIHSFWPRSQKNKATKPPSYKQVTKINRIQSILLAKTD